MNQRRSGGGLRSLVDHDGRGDRGAGARTSVGVEVARVAVLHRDHRSQRADGARFAQGPLRYRAASAEFEQVIDVEKDVSWLPSVLAGERVFFVGVGSVDAYVDFSNLDEGALDVNDDRTAVTVKLPEPTLAAPVIDIDRSEVANRDRGLLDRLAGVFSDNPTSEKELYLLAEEKMAAAAEESELRDKARRTPRKMLEGLLNGLGFDDVTVEFDADASPQAPAA